MFGIVPLLLLFLPDATPCGNPPYCKCVEQTIICSWLNITFLPHFNNSIRQHVQYIYLNESDVIPYVNLSDWPSLQYITKCYEGECGKLTTFELESQNMDPFLKYLSVISIVPPGFFALYVVYKRYKHLNKQEAATHTPTIYNSTGANKCLI
jgi:hypothetical protein